jgi:hypothetical protein
VRYYNLKCYSFLFRKLRVVFTLLLHVTVLLAICTQFFFSWLHHLFSNFFFFAFSNSQISFCFLSISDSIFARIAPYSIKKLAHLFYFFLYCITSETSRTHHYSCSLHVILVWHIANIEVK